MTTMYKHSDPKYQTFNRTGDGKLLKKGFYAEGGSVKDQDGSGWDWSTGTRWGPRSQQHPGYHWNEAQQMWVPIGAPPDRGETINRAAESSRKQFEGETAADQSGVGFSKGGPVKRR